MNFPGFTAEESLYTSETSYQPGDLADTGGEGVVPQLEVCTPCMGIVKGRQYCVNLGPLGRKCITSPVTLRGKACCWTRFGIPPFGCGIKGC